MASAAQPKAATLDDLRCVEGKAELIAGRIVHLMPTGHRPNRIAGGIFVALKNRARATGRGVAYTDNMGFAVPKLPSGRESFSPDASYYDGPLPAGEDREQARQGPTRRGRRVGRLGRRHECRRTRQSSRVAQRFGAGPPGAEGRGFVYVASSVFM